MSGEASKEVLDPLESRFCVVLMRWQTLVLGLLPTQVLH